MVVGITHRTRNKGTHIFDGLSPRGIFLGALGCFALTGIFHMGGYFVPWPLAVGFVLLIGSALVNN